MVNLETDGQETSTFKIRNKIISNSVGIRSNHKEKSPDKLSCNVVSPSAGWVGRSSFAEAIKRLKKLEGDYQHTYKKYTKLQSEWYRYCTALRCSKHHSRWAGYCINHTENLVEWLQNVLGKLNTEEAPQRERENVKQCFWMHGSKSLAQETMILKMKAENKEQCDDNLSQETVDVKRINEEFSYIQRIIPKSSSKKPIHDLLKGVKEIKKLRDKAIVNGALAGNITSQDDMEKSISIEIKLLTKIIRDFEKEREKTESILENKREIEKGYAEKMRHLREKYECLGEKVEAEKKLILDLKKSFRLVRKTTSQRRGCRQW